MDSGGSRNVLTYILGDTCTQQVIALVGQGAKHMSKRRFVIYADRETDDDIYWQLDDWCKHKQLSARVIEAIRYYLGAQLSDDEVRQLREMIAGMQGAGSSVLPRLTTSGIKPATMSPDDLEPVEYTEFKEWKKEMGIDE